MEENLINTDVLAVVSGTVTNEAGTPVEGATVRVKDTQVGALTDDKGAFKIDVPAGSDILVVTFIGYRTQEVAIGGRSTVAITLAEDISTLDEVIVVGYGTQIKKDLTGSIGSIRGEEIVSKPITSPDQILAGRVAGVNITNRSGDPAAPINVRIRGVGTPGVNQPLWVIDGVPIVQTNNITVNTSSTTDSNPLAGINPNDIESIDVLKDASAAAIYGARAANGVVIVTTKRGSAGKTTVSYNGYLGTAQVRKKLDVLDVNQYIAIQGELGRDVSEFSGSPFVDWQDAVFKKGPMSNHNVSVSGGNATSNFLIAAGYHNQEGIELGQNFERYTIKANSDIKVGKRFRFGESLLISTTDRSTQAEGGGLLAASGAAQNAPYFAIYDPAGPLGYNQENPATVGLGFGENKVFRTDQRINRTTINSRKALGNVYGEVELFEGLKFKIQGGFDYNVGIGEFLQTETSFDGNSIRQSLLVTSRPIELTTNLSNTLTYDKAFGSHNLTLLAGYEETNFRFDKVRIQGRNLFNVNFASSGTAVAAGNEADLWALKGFLGRINYNYKGKYLFTANVRRDATSRFSTDNRDGIFPSLSAGWRVSDEKFFPQDGVDDDFKIRGGWGQNGNQFTGLNFAFLSALQTTIFYVVGNSQNVVRGPAPVNFANADLKWETSNQFDIGFDATLLKGKVDMTFDYYSKTTSDVLIGLPVPYTSGYFLPADANVGEIKNSGFEFALNHRNKVGAFNYSIGANITTVKNEVTDLGSVPQIISGIGGAQTHRTIVGESLGHFYGYQVDGIYQNSVEADAALPDAFSAGAEPGDIRFKDVNGDGMVNADDRTILGSPIPGYFYGAYIQGAIKGFDISIQLRGVGDVQVYNSARIPFEDLSGNSNFSTRVLDRWTGEGTSTEIPRLTRTDPNSNNRYSDRWVEDADYLRLNNIQIGYTLPGENLQKWTKGFISNCRAFIGVQNLVTITGYLGFDPEVTRAQSFQKGEFILASGQDGGVSPQPRIYQIGWNLTF